MRRALAVVVMIACRPSIGDQPCDPLASETTDESLVDVRGVGRSEAGVLYVIDDVDHDSRVYVSEGDLLVRHRVLGFGETNQGDTTTVVLSVSGQPQDFVLAHEQTGSDVRMALAFGIEARDIESVITAGELIEVVPNDTVDGMDASFVREVELEYHARIEADEEVVVVRPRDDWDYDDFRVFIGPADTMAEHRVYEVLRALDGGSTTIELDYDGSRAVLDFPYVNMAPGQATFTVGGQTRDIDWLDASAFVAGDHAFKCF